MKRPKAKSYADLLEEHRQLEARLAEMRAEALDDATDQVRELIRSTGFTQQEIIARLTHGRRTARRGKMKDDGFRYYRNPDTGEVWKRTGRMPKWLVAKVSEGHEIEEFQI